MLIEQKEQLLPDNYNLFQQWRLYLAAWCMVHARCDVRYPTRLPIL